jgi:hypothetical protein
MPRLLLFAPCQKAILDKGDNLISLIGVIYGMTAKAVGGNLPDPIPENAVVQVPWGLATIWLRVEGDDDLGFEQKVDIVSPTGKRYEAQAQAFQMTQRIHQLALNGDGFPFGEQGEYQLVLQLRSVRADSEWHEVARWPLMIDHNNPS